MNQTEIKEMISMYEAKELKSLTYCELKEFRKYLLLDGNEGLGKKIYARMEGLVREGKVTEEEMIGAAYL